MEHEVLVPLPPHTLRRSLRRPELLARCLPGFTAEDQVDQDGEPVLAGRLKLRVGGSSITYRGELRLEDREADGGDAAFAVRAEQSVGSGEVSGTVRIAVLPDGSASGRSADGGADRVDSAEDRSRVVFRCALAAKGRIEDLDPQAVTVAVRRLLDRFCAALAEDPAVAEPVAEFPDEDPRLFSELVDLGELTDLSRLADFDVPNDLDDLDDFDVPGSPDDAELFLIEEPATAPGAFNGAAALDEPWGDAQPNRRSIVGRSAEEVDHAPPRGRYGPALPSRSARSRAAARWSAPERRMGEPPTAEVERNRVPWMVGGGVALLGGAVILVRALRRRG
ncbi:CoxG family protein [Streptacidiphilus sp. MAP12-16]|uniref:CoxG family protein n=1 Tax=Streptacidiphilus sp. MAP12-16 TaxID=3156300 RepID=UPI003517A5B7